MMGAGAVIRVAILGETKGLHEATKMAAEDLDHLQQKAQTNGQKITAFAKKATAVMAAGALAIAAIAVKNGDELNESADQLSLALENSKQHVKNLDGVIAPLSKRMEKFGYTNKEVDDSLTQFTRSGVKLKVALKDEAIAADLAKAKHISLEAATTLVAKASQGQIKGLKALAIDLPVAAGGALKLKNANVALSVAEGKLKDAQDGRSVVLAKANALLDDSNFLHLKGAALVKARAAAEARGAEMLDAADKKIKDAQAGVVKAQHAVNDVQHAGDKILGALATRMKGSAAESTKSLAGKTAALKAKFTDMTAHLGQKLIPILLALGVKFGKLIDFFSRNKAALVALIAVVGLFVATMVTLTIIDTVRKAQEAWNKVMAATDALMDANPIVLVVAAIVALGVAAYEAYKHFDTFHRAVDRVWQLLQDGFHWIQKNWPLLLAILSGPIGLAVFEIHRHWSQIVDGAHAAVSDIKGFFVGIPAFLVGLGPRFVSAAKSTGAALLSGILHGLDSATDGVAGFIMKIARGIKDLVNRYIIDPIRNVEIKWGGFHGIGKFDIKPFSFIPRLHEGGVFNSGRGEGLALLRDGEGVFTPAQMNALGAGGVALGRSGSMIFNFPAGVDPAAVVRAQVRYNRRNGLS